MCMDSGMWEKKSMMRQPSWMCVFGLGFSACTMSGNFMPSRMKNTGKLLPTCHMDRTVRRCNGGLLLGCDLGTTQHTCHVLSMSDRARLPSYRSYRGRTSTYGNSKHAAESAIAHQIPVALPRVELDRKAARVAQRLGRAALVDDRRESHDDRRLDARRPQEVRARQMRHVVGHLRIRAQMLQYQTSC